MTRIQKLRKLATKRFGTRTLTSEDTRQLLDNYMPGVRQQHKGELMSTTIDRFLAQLPKFNRDSFESEVRELHTYSNFKRFRIRALTLIMTAYQNGSASGKPFDVQGLIKTVAEEIADKYKI